MKVVLIQVFFLSLLLNKIKIKMKTRNIMALSHHSKVSSAQKHGVPFFCCLGHTSAVMELSIIPLFLVKVKVFPIILACQSQLTCNVCMKTVNEFGVSNVAKWLNVRLGTKLLWNRFPLQLLKFKISHLFRVQSSLTFRQV